MKKLLLIVAVISTPAFAWESDNDNQGYKSRFGNEYEYDLSRPADRLRYEVDPRAQIRDELNVDPKRDIERDLGEYGAGKREKRRY